VRRAADLMLDAVDRQIAAMVATRDRMQQTLRAWDRRLTEAGDSRPAYLVETLGTTDRPRHGLRLRRTPPR
jgi:hypothetical protein